jgi:Tol biopolymer transport system component
LDALRADGSDKRRLTNIPDFDAEPTWSPDGQQIAFRRSTAVQGSDIMIVAAGGGRAHTHRDARSGTEPRVVA